MQYMSRVTDNWNKESSGEIVCNNHVLNANWNRFGIAHARILNLRKFILIKFQAKIQLIKRFISEIRYMREYKETHGNSFWRNEGRNRWLLSLKLVEIRQTFLTLPCCLSFLLLRVTCCHLSGKIFSYLICINNIYLIFVSDWDKKKKAARRNLFWETLAKFWVHTYTCIKEIYNYVFICLHLWEIIMLLEIYRIILPLQVNIIFTCHHWAALTVLELHVNGIR